MQLNEQEAAGLLRALEAADKWMACMIREGAHLGTVSPRSARWWHGQVQVHRAALEAKMRDEA